jgi:hypothetical protein
MSRMFYGYVEVLQGGQWEEVFSTDTFIAGGNDGPMARLFGVPGDSVIGERGIPTDASPAIRDYYAHFANDEYMRGDIIHPSWLLHSEWVALAEEVMAFHNGWRTLYRMMEALADFFGAERVRFIAWQMV